MRASELPSKERGIQILYGFMGGSFESLFSLVFSLVFDPLFPRYFLLLFRFSTSSPFTSPFNLMFCSYCYYYHLVSLTNRWIASEPEFARFCCDTSPMESRSQTSLFPTQLPMAAPLAVMHNVSDTLCLSLRKLGPLSRGWSCMKEISRFGRRFTQVLFGTIIFRNWQKSEKTTACSPRLSE